LKKKKKELTSTWVEWVENKSKISVGPERYTNRIKGSGREEVFGRFRLPVPRRERSAP